MDQQSFFLMLTAYLRKRFPGDVLFSLQPDGSGTSLSMNGLGTAHPVLIPLDEFRLRKTASPDEIFREIEFRCAEIYLRCRSRPLRPLSYTEAKERLVLRVLPLRGEAGFLKTHPHRRLGAFALLCGIRHTEPFPYVSYIDRIQLKDWNKDEQTLYRDTLKVCSQTEPPLLLPAGDLLEQLAKLYPETGQPADRAVITDFHVLTNDRMEGGASALFYPGLLPCLHRRFGSFFFLLTSPDEVLLFPAGNSEARLFAGSPSPSRLSRDMPGSVLCRFDRLSAEIWRELQLQLDKAQRFR